MWHLIRLVLRNKLKISFFFLRLRVAEDEVATVISLSSHFTWVTEVAAATSASVAVNCEFAGNETVSLSLKSVNLKRFYA